MIKKKQSVEEHENDCKMYLFVYIIKKTLQRCFCNYMLIKGLLKSSVIEHICLRVISLKVIELWLPQLFFDKTKK